MSGDGERIALAWEGSPAAALAAEWRVPAVHLFASVGSTNDVARRLAADDAAHGTVVLADEQLAGRGQSGRSWASPPGLGIWMSLVLRPEDLSAPGLLPLYVGLAAATALDDFCRPRRVRIKWPNDLFLGGRKLGGVLCEASWTAAGPAWVVVGIGVNVLQRAEEIPSEIRDSATSLRRETGRAAPRAQIARSLAVAIAELRHFAPDPELCGRLNDRDALRGKPVRIVDSASGEHQLSGRAAGIAEDGALRVRTAAGELKHVRAGSVRL